MSSSTTPAAVSSLGGSAPRAGIAAARSLGIRRRDPSGRARTQVSFAHRSVATRELPRDALSALRSGTHWDESSRHFHVLQTMQYALADQHEIRTWLQRVPGRSEAHRRGALQRLIHARNGILNMPFESRGLESHGRTWHRRCSPLRCDGFEPKKQPSPQKRPAEAGRRNTRQHG